MLNKLKQIAKATRRTTEQLWRHFRISELFYNYNVRGLRIIISLICNLIIMMICVAETLIVYKLYQQNNMHE